MKTINIDQVDKNNIVVSATYVAAVSKKYVTKTITVKKGKIGTLRDALGLFTINQIKEKKQVLKICKKYFTPEEIINLTDLHTPSAKKLKQNLDTKKQNELWYDKNEKYLELEINRIVNSKGFLSNSSF